jgi:hypothetical protein
MLGGCDVQASSTVRSDSAVRGLTDVDFEILARIAPLLGDGLQRWWDGLKESDQLCNMLARTDFIAVIPAGAFHPLSWLPRGELRGRTRVIAEEFSVFNWNVPYAAPDDVPTD